MNEETRSIRSCEGYEILKSGRVGEREVVIGYNPNAPNPYVCWYCKNDTDYYWGCYGNSYETAREKWEERYRSLSLRFCGRQEKKPKTDRER